MDALRFLHRLHLYMLGSRALRFHRLHGCSVSTFLCLFLIFLPYVSRFLYVFYWTTTYGSQFISTEFKRPTHLSVEFSLLCIQSPLPDNKDVQVWNNLRHASCWSCSVVFRGWNGTWTGVHWHTAWSQLRKRYVPHDLTNKYVSAAVAIRFSL